MDNSNTKPTSISKPKLFYGWYLVAACWIMSFLVTATSIGIFFKPILDEFGWDRATLSGVSAITVLLFAGFNPLIGRLIDHFGPRAMLLVGTIGQVLSSVINGLATGIASIFAGRFIYEIRPTHATQVLINYWFVKNRGKALGILSSGPPLGTLVLSPISQYLILSWGWRMTFFFWAGITAVVFLPLILLVRNKPEQIGLSPDGATSVAQPTSGEKLFSPIKANDFSVRASTGLSFRQALQSRSFLLLSIGNVVCGIGCGLIGTHTVIFATDLGYSPIIGASFFSVQGGLSLLGVLVTGHISDRMARNRVLSMVFLIRSISFILLVVAVLLHGPLWMLYLGMVLFGFGWFTTAPLIAGLSADLFGNLRIGTILGLMLAFHAVGSALGAYAGGLSYQLTHSYLPIFSVQGVLELTAAILVFSIVISRSQTR